MNTCNAKRVDVVNRLGMEALEGRRMLVVEVGLVEDINPGPASSLPGELTASGSSLFFTANTPAKGVELWSSDGTALGTLAAHPTATSGKIPRDLTDANGTLFFVYDGASTDELWRAEQSQAGVFRVKAGLQSTSQLTNVDGQLYFSADDGLTGVELWKSNGTSAGTSLVEDIRTVGSGSFPGQLTDMNGTLYFSALYERNNTGDRELWRSAGTPADTFLVKNVNPLGRSDPGQLTNVNGVLYFTADDGSHGRELWRSDGTSAGTLLSRDINTSGSSNPHNLRNVRDALFFAANDGTRGDELWVISGLTQKVFDINHANGVGSEPQELVDVNGTLYFTADDGIHGRELWKSDGITTSLVADLSPGNASSNPSELTNIGGILFFSANTANAGVELWTSQGTSDSTFMLADLAAGIESSNPQDFTYLSSPSGHYVLFTADGDDVGRELWSVRAIAEDIVVSSLEDGVDFDLSPGNMSLREAILLANLLPDHNRITFESGLFNTPRTIVLQSTLPTIVNSVTIDGPGRGLLTFDGGNGLDGVPETGDGFSLYRIVGIDGSVAVNLSGMTLTGGDSSTRGGAINSTAADVTLTDLLIHYNASVGSVGGAIAISSGSLSLQSSSIEHNSSDFRYEDSAGGGLYSEFASMSINRSSIANNSSSQGGGIASRNSVIIINESTIADNLATTHGGGVFSKFDDVFISNSTIAHNRAEGSNSLGGGLFQDQSRVSLKLSTVSGNTAASGGGLFVSDSKPAPIIEIPTTRLMSSPYPAAPPANGIEILHSTITSNRATNGQGGGIEQGGGIVLSDVAGNDLVASIGHTILSGNVGMDAEFRNPYNYNGINSLGFNLIGNGNGIGAFIGPGDLTGRTNPGLSQLANNGGITMTHDLLPNSPAIDRGDSRIMFRADEFDQRGAPYYRVVDIDSSGVANIDIGAVEMADFDGDGIPNSWETTGIDADWDGVIDLDLGALGANPYHKDIFVEVDAMSGLGPASQVPPIGAVSSAGLSTGTILDQVVESFLNAPVPNPDGQTGINLHIFIDEMNLPRAQFTQSRDYDQLVSTHFVHPSNPDRVERAKQLVFRYGLFADSYRGSTQSGYNEGLGNEFMITLGAWNEPTEAEKLRGVTWDKIVAGTFMHELGHSLGLRHGGGDDLNYKPNYHSVMNYTWQVPVSSYAGSWELDFSEFSDSDLPPLDERRLNEAAGVGFPTDSGHNTHVVPAGGRTTWSLVPEYGPVDWDNDGSLTSSGIKLDVNQDGRLDKLSSFNDWELLRYNFRGVNEGGCDGDVDETGGLLSDSTCYRPRELCNLPGLVPFGDLNKDGSVDAADAGIMFSNWAGRVWCLLGDLDEGSGFADGIVDAADAGVLFKNWTGDGDSAITYPQLSPLPLKFVATFAKNPDEPGIELIDTFSTVCRPTAANESVPHPSSADGRAQHIDESRSSSMTHTKQRLIPIEKNHRTRRFSVWPRESLQRDAVDQLLSDKPSRTW